MGRVLRGSRSLEMGDKGHGPTAWLSTPRCAAPTIQLCRMKAAPAPGACRQRSAGRSGSSSGALQQLSCRMLALSPHCFARAEARCAWAVPAPSPPGTADITGEEIPLQTSPSTPCDVYRAVLQVWSRRQSTALHDIQGGVWLGDSLSLQWCLKPAKGTRGQLFTWSAGVGRCLALGSVGCGAKQGSPQSKGQSRGCCGQGAPTPSAAPQLCFRPLTQHQGWAEELWEECSAVCGVGSLRTLWCLLVYPDVVVVMPPHTARKDVLKRCIWTVAKGPQRSGSSECWVWAPGAAECSQLAQNRVLPPWGGTKGSPSSHSDEPQSLAWKHSSVQGRANAKHEGFGRTIFLMEFQPGRKETSAPTGMGSLEAGARRYHCHQELSRQCSIWECFPCWKRSQGAIATQGSGSAIPDAVCKADGAAQGGRATQPLSAGQSQLMTGKSLPALGTWWLFWRHVRESVAGHRFPPVILVEINGHLSYRTSPYGRDGG